MKGIILILSVLLSCLFSGSGQDYAAVEEREHETVVEYLNGKDVTPQVKKGSEGGSVRLDVFYNATEGIAYAQLFDFRNYSYEPETDVVELHSPKADKLISQL